MSIDHQHHIIASSFFTILALFFLLLTLVESFPHSYPSDPGYVLPTYQESGTEGRLRAALEEAPTPTTAGVESTSRPVYSPALAALAEPCNHQDFSDGTEHSSIAAEGDWVRPRTSAGVGASAFCYSFHRSHAPLTWPEAVFHCRALHWNAGSLTIETSTQAPAGAGAELLWLSESDLAEAQWAVRAARAVATDVALARGGSAEGSNATKTLLLLNAHRYIYNARGPAWASGELLSGRASANGSTATAAAGSGEDLVCNTHTADNETSECYVLELQNGRTLAFRCTDSLQDALVVCKRRSRPASEVVSPTNSSISNTTAAPELQLPRPPHCVDTISSSTTDVSRFNEPGWTERRVRPGLSAFYYQDPAARPATWVHAYHSCRNLGADLLWLENMEEARWVHEQARKWADASRYRFRLLLVHEYLFGAGSNRWVDGTAVARPPPDAVRARGRHSFLDPKTLRYLKIMSGNEAYCGKLRLDEIFDSADIWDENCTCTSKWLENLFICKLKVFRAQSFSTTRSCAPGATSSALTRASTHPAVTFSTASPASSFRSTELTPTPGSELEYTLRTRAQEEVSTSTTAGRAGPAYVDSLNPPAEWDTPRTTWKPSRPLRVIIRTLPRPNYTPTIAPVPRFEEHLRSNHANHKESNTALDSLNGEQRFSTQSDTSIMGTTQKVPVQEVVEVQGGSKGGGSGGGTDESDERFRSIISPVLALIVTLLCIALVLACIVGTMHICCRSTCCCCFFNSIESRSRQQQQSHEHGRVQTMGSERQEHEQDEQEKEKQKKEKVKEASQGSCCSLCASFMHLPGSAGLRDGVQERGKQARSGNRTGDATKVDGSQLVREFGPVLNGPVGEQRGEASEEVLGSRVCDQHIYYNVSPLFGQYPLTELNPPPNDNQSPNNVPSSLQLDASKNQTASSADSSGTKTSTTSGASTTNANCKGNKTASATDSGTGESPPHSKVSTRTPTPPAALGAERENFGTASAPCPEQQTSAAPSSSQVQTRAQVKLSAGQESPQVTKHEFPCHPATHSNQFPSHPFAKKLTSGTKTVANTSSYALHKSFNGECDSPPKPPPHANSSHLIIQMMAASNKGDAINTNTGTNGNSIQKNSPKKQSALANGSLIKCITELPISPRKSPPSKTSPSPTHAILIKESSADGATETKSEAAAVMSLSACEAGATQESIRRSTNVNEVNAPRPKTCSHESSLQRRVLPILPTHAHGVVLMPLGAPRPAGAAAGAALALSESVL